jgi:hypothetical protein
MTPLTQFEKGEEKEGGVLREYNRKSEFVQSTHLWNYHNESPCTTKVC